MVPSLNYVLASVLSRTMAAATLIIAPACPVVISATSPTSEPSRLVSNEPTLAMMHQTAESLRPTLSQLFSVGCVAQGSQLPGPSEACCGPTHSLKEIRRWRPKPSGGLAGTGYRGGRCCRYGGVICRRSATDTAPTWGSPTAGDARSGRIICGRPYAGSPGVSFAMPVGRTVGYSG